MELTLEDVQFKFSFIIRELYNRPMMLSQFAVWLDLKLAEYKANGVLALECSGDKPDPFWLRGIKSSPEHDVPQTTSSANMTRMELSVEPQTRNTECVNAANDDGSSSSCVKDLGPADSNATGLHPTDPQQDDQLEESSPLVTVKQEEPTDCEDCHSSSMKDLGPADSNTTGLHPTDPQQDDQHRESSPLVTVKQEEPTDCDDPQTDMEVFPTGLHMHGNQDGIRTIHMEVAARRCPQLDTSACAGNGNLLQGDSSTESTNSKLISQTSAMTTENDQCFSFSDQIDGRQDFELDTKPMLMDVQREAVVAVKMEPPARMDETSSECSTNYPDRSLFPATSTIEIPEDQIKVHLNSSKSSAMEHEKSTPRRGEMKRICVHCKTAFLTKITLRKYCEDCRSCKLCDIVFPSHQMLIRHRSRCPERNRSGKSCRGKLASCHHRQMYKCSQPSFNCPDCRQAFPTSKQFNDHRSRCGKPADVTDDNGTDFYSPGWASVTPAKNTHFEEPYIDESSNENLMMSVSDEEQENKLMDHSQLETQDRLSGHSSSSLYFSVKSIGRKPIVPVTEMPEHRFDSPQTRTVTYAGNECIRCNVCRQFRSLRTFHLHKCPLPSFHCPHCRQAFPTSNLFSEHQSRCGNVADVVHSKDKDFDTGSKGLVPSTSAKIRM